MRRKQTTLAEVLERALAPEVRKRIYSVELVASRWAAAVGEELARRSEPEALNDGVLTVRVTDPAWGRTILKLQGRIVPALNRALGKNLVRRINFTTRERLVRDREPIRPPEPPPEVVAPASVLRAAEAITDPELRAMATRSAARYLHAQEERRKKRNR